MSKAMLCALATMVASAAFGQGAPAATAADPAARVPELRYRSAFEGFRQFADEEVRNWRGANDEVGAAGGHAGHRPGQGPGTQSSKPQPGAPEGSGKPAAQDRPGGHQQ